MSGRKKRSRGGNHSTPASRSGRLMENPRKPKAFSYIINESNDSNDSSTFEIPTGTPPATPSRSTRSKKGRRAAQKSRSFIQKFAQNNNPDEDVSLLYSNPAELASFKNLSSGESDDESHSSTVRSTNQQSLPSLSDPDFSDSNDTGSDDSDDDTYSSVSITKKTCPLRTMPEPIPDIDPKLIPTLVLPPTSTDLNVPVEHLMDALGIYETLRHYRTILRLSPFRFEDFCTALQQSEQCCMLAEIHIAFLRALLREEDGNNTTFGPQDLKDSINISFMFMDGMTWPELVRSYLESDNCWEFQTALHAFNNCGTEYPYSDIKTKIIVLKTLNDMFLATNAVREEIMNEGNIQYDDHCRACHK